MNMFRAGPNGLSKIRTVVQWGSGDLIKEYQWLIIFRWAGVALLLLASLAAYFLHYIEVVSPLIAICAAIAVYNIAIVRTGTRREGILISLFLDVTALTAFFHFSGDIENPLMLAYALPVIAGAIVISRKAGFALAAFASILMVALAFMTMVDASPIHLKHYHLALVPELQVHLSVDPDVNDEGWHYLGVNLVPHIVLMFAAALGFGSLSDLLRRKEKAIEADNEKMSLLLSVLPDGVVLLQRDGTVIWHNPTARKIFPNLGDASIASMDEIRDLQRRLGSAEAVQEFETKSPVRILGHAIVHVASGGPIVWLIRDLTQQRKQMAGRMHQSKMLDLGMLAAGIAHEIGNPLSSISAGIELIELKKSPPDLPERLKAISGNVERISRIVQQVTSFARPSLGQKSRVSARGLFEKALQIFRFHEKAKELKIDVAVTEPSLVLEVVEDQLVQVLLNLLLNAADASGNRGTISLAAREDGKDAILSVEDKGVGMSTEIRNQLFTPFFTTKEPGRGVGLGLSISESIVRAHGGRMEIESAPGLGSTFFVILPHPAGGTA
jgi:signal transduction histidine kinase